jgi:RNA polymerase sigma-70 factor (ECF subfamily)
VDRNDPAWLEEAALAQRAASDRYSFGTLYDRYFPRVYNYMRFRCSDPQTADDLTALVFEKALRDIARYQADRAPFAVWLFTIARNALTDHLRAGRRHPWLSFDLLGGQSNPGHSTEEALIQAETRDSLMRALARLSERERDLIALKFQAGLNNRQIAAMTHLSESNVGVTVFRAIQRLRVLMEGHVVFEEGNRYERA